MAAGNARVTDALDIVHHEMYSVFVESQCLTVAGSNYMGSMEPPFWLHL